MIIKEDLAGFEFPKLRHCTGAGEPLNPEVIEVWREKFGLTIHDGYGQTETTILAANMPGMPVKPGSMGLPFPGHDVRVLNNDLAETEVGEIGEIALRVSPGASAVAVSRILEKRRRDRQRVQGRMVPDRRPGHARRRRLSMVRRSRRRRDNFRRLQNRPVRSGERAAGASRGDGIRSSRDPRRRSRLDRQGLREAPPRRRTRAIGSSPNSRNTASASPLPTNTRAK